MAMSYRTSRFCEQRIYLLQTAGQGMLASTTGIISSIICSWRIAGAVLLKFV